MRINLFIAILSLFLVVQVVSTESITFASIVKKLYGQSKSLKSKFDFMLKITKDIDAIKKKLEKMPRKAFLEHNTSEYILKHVPEDLQINGTDARQVLREKIDAINEGETISIKEIDDQICTRITFKSKGILDEAIEKSYKNWAKNPVDAHHLKQINLDYPTMKSKFDNWQKTFIDEMKAADVLRDEIKAYFNGANSIFKTLLNEPHNASETAEKYVDGILDGILVRHYRLIKKLESAADVLQKYNNERVIWTEFIIGMRAKLESDPKPVELKQKKKK
ncbi:uncharacterized protein LOC116341273 [Contarinia nasturtii]|uniref:uncharacterized protein LOC116341273 n=1 Tax=Contarinia nasturtii TaxID=265458 RepID=UPI0012D3F411|nr:uncharacterized protein LOC116341273 [Contarinia nasturtii]